ncbi:sulfate transporter family-domain-containing protein [Gaertneriomyces semiglobifer]|nr:sulfate transporter family-domain-containing protein [Gaertneriomyces semiglobifer]
MVTPAVILALILNVLDAMSYGIIIFPPSDRMPNTTVQAGLALFLASTLVSQLTYTLGGSKFRGAVGSMMIEVMPFLHIFVRTIEAQMKDASDHAVLATIMCVFAMSTVLTGIVFGVLGYFRLGNLIQFFPRHILVGCIGGIGFFLMLTGIEVTTHISNEYSMHWVKRIFELYALKLWGGSLLLALFLKALQRRVHHPLFVPLFYVCIPIAFYAVVFIGRWPISKVREAGWLFSLPGGGGAPFYEFWKYFDFTAVQWSAIPATFPTQLALAFFGVLHVPINVPALAVSTHQDVDLNKELVGHGVSNLIAGLLGLPQNYLVYSNSLLYIRSGGDSLFGGLLLSLCTGLVWVAGGNFVEFVPTIVVGSLIFHLGIDLMKESLYDTWNTGMHSLEYMTILMIVVVMGRCVVGFTEGIGVGVVLACVFFVVMYSRKSVIRGTYSGTQLRSTVHRMYRQQCFLDQVGDQIRCIKLQGFMFFGTVNQLDEHIGQLLSESPRMRFLVFDFSLIYGIDYSAIESFHRIKRLLGDSNTHLVLAGVSAFSRILAQSGIFDEVSLVNEESVEVPVHSFDNINEALEWCENQLLTTYYEKYALQSASATAVPYSILTPRRVEVQQAASLILREAPLVHHAQEKEELLPVAILLQAFSDTGDCDDELLRFFEGRFQRVAVKSGTVLWLPGEDANELYIVEKGELVMGITESDAGRIKVVETLLPGTMVGELEMFCGRPRACRLIASDDSLLWSLTKEAFNAMSVENPQLVLKFVTKVALSFDAVRYHNTVYHYVR